MVLLASTGGTLTITANPWPSNFGELEVTDAAWPEITLTVTNEAGIAFAQRFQRFGVRVDLERAPGDGTMITLPDHLSVGAELTIEESADTFGDVLRLNLTGEKWSPFARHLLRTMAKIEVYFTIGSPQFEWSQKVFTGWITVASFDVQALTATVTALDAAALHAEKRAKDWSLPPGSGRTRLDITNELLGIGDIPAGALDFGENDGGIVNKPHTIGDRPIIEFLREFLNVIGVEVGSIDGKFVAVRYDPDYPPVAELTPSNLTDSASIASPETLRANVVGVVATSFTLTPVAGVSPPIETRSETVGPYTPVAAAQVQDDGIFSENEVPTFEAIQTIAETVTRVSHLGSLAIRTETEVRGWRADRTAGARIRRIGTAPVDGVWAYEIQPAEGTVYIFPDGSTRATREEEYQTLRRSVEAKDVDAENYVIRVREEQYHLRQFRQAIFEVDEITGGIVDVPPLAFMPISDEGEGLLGDPREQLGRYGPDELTITDYTLGADGVIDEEVKTEYFFDIGAKVRRANLVHGYGVDEPRHYSTRSAEAPTVITEPPDDPFYLAQLYGGVRVTTVTYRDLGEDQYQAISVVREGDDEPVVTTQTFTGSRPHAERAEPTSTSQELRSIVEDEQRIAFVYQAYRALNPPSSEEDDEALWERARIEDVEHNEFIETQEEADVYALIRARRAAALPLTCQMPIETLIHKWKTVRVKLPGIGADSLTLYVRSVQRDATSFLQTITADWYPPTLR